MKPPTKITLAVIEDHPLFRKGLVQALQEVPDFAVLGEAESLSEARELLSQQAPQIALVDLRLRDESGLALVQEIRDAHPATKAIVLSAYDYPHYVRAAVEAGAAGYLLKDEPAHHIADAVRGVARGERRRFSPAARDRLGELGVEPLTPREEEIVARLAQGEGVQDIAAELSLSVRTVRNHLNNVFGKLDLHSQPELVAWAWRTGSFGP